jgi:glutamate--cysteine ligase catalytic subunit
MMGVDDFIYLPQPFAAPYSLSDYLPDYILNPHPRFAALASNIRTRRGQKVDIRMPLFRDTYTPEFLRLERKSYHEPDVNGHSHDLTNHNHIDYKMNDNDNNNKRKRDNAQSFTKLPRSESTGNRKFTLEPDTDIHMDAMGFGMGMCCLVSFLLQNIFHDYIYLSL